MPASVGTTITLGSAAIAAVAWLARSLVLHFMSRDLDAHKIRLEEQAKRVLLEHEVRYRDLHARRANVIADLYGLIADAASAAKRFLDPVAFGGEPDTQEKHKKLLSALGELFQQFDRNRIFLPEETCRRVDSLVEAIRKPTWDYAFYVWNPDAAQDDFEGKYDSWKTAWQSVSEEDGKLAEARAALERDFRSILGEPSGSEGSDT